MIVNVKPHAILRQLRPPGTSIGESFTLKLDLGTVSETRVKLRLPEDKVKLILVNDVHVGSLNHKLEHGNLTVVIPRLPVGSALS